MGRAVDLTGKRFGQLTVKGKAGVEKGRSVWHVLCDCGREDLITRPEKLKSCGCLRRKDLSGQTFGKLTVQALEKVDENGKACWKCLCSCGLTTVVRGNDLTAGKTKSCGCKTLKHGCSDTPEYKVYKQLTEDHASTFRDWEHFLETIGGRPSEEYRIARKNVNEPHGQENTYWRNADVERTAGERLTSADLPEECVFDFRAYLRATASAG